MVVVAGSEVEVVDVGAAKVAEVVDEAEVVEVAKVAEVAEVLDEAVLLAGGEAAGLLEQEAATRLQPTRPAVARVRLDRPAPRQVPFAPPLAEGPPLTVCTGFSASSS
ncbi:MAG TPA: hypothetical protein VME20_14455 [Acidimicrobiales bacterium]|nr:hypothetical protein [Acidimicrobiales bacterium]